MEGVEAKVLPGEEAYMLHGAGERRARQGKQVMEYWMGQVAGMEMKVSAWKEVCWLDGASLEAAFMPDDVSDRHFSHVFF